MSVQLAVGACHAALCRGPAAAEVDHLAVGAALVHLPIREVLPRPVPA